MYTWFQPIIAVLAQALSYLHTFTHDWGVSIILLTLVVKMALFRFNLTAARQHIRTAAMGPHLKKLQQTHAADPNRLMQESGKLYREHEVNPFAQMGGVLLQLPVLSAMYGLFLTHGSAMSSLLVPWVSHLALADPLHVLPVLTGLMTFVVSLIPLTETAGPAPGSGKRAMLGVVLMLIPLLVTWRAPIALGLYWMAGSAFGLLERLLYRTAFGKRLLRKGTPEPAQAS
ncbi:YidC/Oxa1 family membrane protein insertase [Paenibacillus validus]|uniref:Membrane protein insertase YidC n=1 Tax=Paenibacillus validus TaxID=44253 RepID=A0A7X3CTN2_9BACL|nr:YidC/Oxa1 family membrane protein insertase [Paenibacillus validus]MUG71214.1 membrane protein insertase YidC [Paenibacillus validus]